MGVLDDLLGSLSWKSNGKKIRVKKATAFSRDSRYKHGKNDVFGNGKGFSDAMAKLINEVLKYKGK